MAGAPAGGPRPGPLATDVDVVQRTQNAEDLQQPEHHRDDDHAVEDRLDAGRHGNAIDEAEQNSNDDEDDDAPAAGRDAMAAQVVPCWPLFKPAHGGGRAFCRSCFRLDPRVGRSP